MYLPRLRTLNANRSYKKKMTMLKKARSRWYPTDTITDANYADDLVLLANTPAQAESLLKSLDQAAGSIGHYVNTNNTECICFEQGGAISILNSRPLKLVAAVFHLLEVLAKT